jgi:hypothetical protein
MTLPLVDLGGTGVRTTILGFGCATLFREPDPAERSRLLATAYDVGIRHFDVAPMYGLGRAEPELGRFIRRRRSQVTVTTKFGISPTLVARCLARVQRPARRVLRPKTVVSDQVREHAAAPSRRLYDTGGYDPVSANRSLRQSLRRLGTDYVDVLLLHDPAPGSVRSADLCEFLEDARTAGLIRTWGITGDPRVAEEVAQGFRQVPVRQLRSDVFASAPATLPAGAALISYGAIGSPLGRIVRHVRASAASRERWRAETGGDCGDPDVTSAFLLRAALRANDAGPVLFGTTRPPHIRSAAAVAAPRRDMIVPDEPDLNSFISLVRTEILMPAAGARRV